MQHVQNHLFGLWPCPLTKSNMLVILIGNYGTSMSGNIQMLASFICSGGGTYFTGPMVTRPTISWRLTKKWMPPHGARRGGDTLRRAYLVYFPLFTLST